MMAPWSRRRSSRLLVGLIVLLWVVPAAGQALHVHPRGASLPATCRIGAYFVLTTAAAGQKTYLCESANTWVQQGGSPEANVVAGSTVGGLPTPSAGQIRRLTDGGAPGALVIGDGSNWTCEAAKSQKLYVVTCPPYNAKADNVTDDTAAIQAAINAADAGGGGTIYFPPGTYVVLGQITFPYTGTFPPKQNAMRLVGAGASASGIFLNLPGGVGVPKGGTILDIRYNGTTAKILTIGSGLLEITGITFTNTAADALPWIYTTNTTLWIHNNAFYGSKERTACDQDVIILGGTTTVHSTTALDAPFQGYGTVIRDNFFDKIRRAVHCRVFCNGVVISGNTIWELAGSNIANIAPIEVDGGASPGFASANAITNNLIEFTFYKYGIKLTAEADANYLMGNMIFTEGGGTAFAEYFICSPTCTENMIIGRGSDRVDSPIQPSIGDNFAINVLRPNVTNRQILARKGAAGQPGYSFAEAASTGMYVSGSQLVFEGPLGPFAWADNNLPSRFTALLVGLGTGVGTGADVLFQRDAANILARKNGAIAQEDRIYNRDSGDDDEYFTIDWKTTANRLTIGPKATGTATLRDMTVDFGSGITFANLGTPKNGVLVYCSDCTVANPCASGGMGALAKRLNGAWVCD
jgi:hypothetical protein